MIGIEFEIEIGGRGEAAVAEPAGFASGSGFAAVSGFFASVLLLFSLAVPTSVAGQGTALDRGLDALRTGEYDDAVRMLEGAARGGAVGDRVRAARALAEAQVAVGEYEAALESLERVAASGGVAPAELATARGRVLMEVGRHTEALAAFDEALAGGASDAIEARVLRGELLFHRGGRTAAYDAFEEIIALYNDGRVRTAAELTAAGTALRYLGRLDSDHTYDALRLFEEALAEDREALEPRVRMADLLLAKYTGDEAQTVYRELLAMNPRHPAGLLGMARAERFAGSPAAMERTEAALAVNPRSPDARAFLGLLRLEQGDDASAVAEADRALAVNPRHVEALAVRATARFLAGDRGAFEADRERALDVNPRAGGFYATVAELAVRRGRYYEAVELAEQGVAADSTAWDAMSILGMNQLRIGRVDEARATLERAFAGDPFNVWTDNTLKLMDDLAGFQVVRTARFELVMAPDEVELLLPYMEPAAEEAYQALADRYDFDPVTPIRVEVYPDHRDFSVRTTGLTGLGALGVAFGNVLAMDSPSARDPGTFHWGSTLWHEIAHTFTLGMTAHRTPRWFTEGISVREERRSRPGWGEPVSFAFLQAFDQELLLPMDRIDAGFVRPTYPGQVGVSYQHASVVVELIEEDHGTGAIRLMLDAYREGQDTETVFDEVLGTSLAAFDRRFDAWVRERFAAGLAAARSMTAEGEDGEAHPGVVALGGRGGGAGIGTLMRRADEQPGSFGAQLAAGSALYRADRLAESERYLERAIDLYPEFIGPGSPYMLLAEARMARGDDAGAADLLRRLTDLDESALRANLMLAELLERTGDLAGAADALDRAVFLYPFDADAHDRLAELAVALERPELEVRERKALVALRPVDRAGALYRLAVAQRRAGRVDEARATVMAALEIAPSFPEAQDLFLELVGGGS